MDQGGNPETITQKDFEGVRGMNEHLRGKLFSTKALEQQLRSRMGAWDKVYPIVAAESEKVQLTADEDEDEDQSEDQEEEAEAIIDIT